MVRHSRCTNLFACSVLVFGLAGLNDAFSFSFNVAAKIVFEAEAGKVSKPFKVIDSPNASGGKAVYLKEKTNKVILPGKEFYKGKIVFEFNVEKEADYVLWLRKKWDDGCGNSIYAVVDKPLNKKNVLTLGEDGTYGKFTWISVPNEKLHLKKGKHTLILQNREDGIRLDQVALIEYEKDQGKDGQYIPVTAEVPSQTDVKPKK